MFTLFDSLPEPKWYTLESRCRTKNASGRLLLGIRLFMTKRASSRASKVGGIEALKRVAEKRMDISRYEYGRES